MMLTVALAAVVVTGCASRAGSGGGSVPRPFPGAAVPPGAGAPPANAGIVPARPSPLGDVIATALSLRGTPYRWGGSDPSGFDCSGFVQWVFARHGAGLPREVRDQFRTGREIDPDEVQPGDLVFFQTIAKGASHVGLAIGDGQFVHAPSSRGVVRVERFTSGYWATRWVGARRVTPATTRTD